MTAAHESGLAATVENADEILVDVDDLVHWASQALIDAQAAIAMADEDGARRALESASASVNALYALAPMACWAILVIDGPS